MRPHIARPGPAYWDWRCLVCSEPVNDRRLHPGRLRLLWRRAPHPHTPTPPHGRMSETTSERTTA